MRVITYNLFLQSPGHGEVGTLGLITLSPNLMIHDQTPDVLRGINMALRTSPETGKLKEVPPPEYTECKLIRYTSDHYEYGLSANGAVDIYILRRK